MAWSNQEVYGKFLPENNNVEIHSKDLGQDKIILKWIYGIIIEGCGLKDRNFVADLRAINFYSRNLPDGVT